MQQGSTPQIIVSGGLTVLPAGSQQQQPLQSIQVVIIFSGAHMHAPESPEPVLAVPVLAVPLLDPVLAVPLLVPVLAVPLLVPVLAVPLLVPVLAVPLLAPVLVPLLAVPLLVPELAVPLLVPVLAVPLLAVPEVEVPLVVPELEAPLLVPELAEPLLVPVLPPSSPPVGEELLLHAASPTVDEAPMTTTTWNSLSIFMRGTIPPGGEDRPRKPCPPRKSRVSRAASFSWDAMSRFVLTKRDPFEPFF